MVAPVLLIFVLASGIPNIDVRKTCRAAQATGVSADQKAAYNGCVADENEARQTLARTWGRLKPAYKQSCVDGTMSLSPSYVELLTCLEMRDGGKFTGGAAGSPSGLGGAAGGVGSTPATPVPGSTSPNTSAATAAPGAGAKGGAGGTGAAATGGAGAGGAGAGGGGGGGGN